MNNRTKLAPMLDVTRQKLQPSLCRRIDYWSHLHPRMSIAICVFLVFLILVAKSYLPN